MSNLKKELLHTEDGSLTIHLSEWNESYHSKHGAIQEAYHVFIKNGLDFFADRKQVSILEIGFGTGLNALITLLESQKRAQNINYVGIEAFPVTAAIYNQLNFDILLKAEPQKREFIQLHESEWEKEQPVSPTFTLKKHQMKFEEIIFENQFDLIYFDAFGYRVQPELWSLDIFQRMYKALKTEGVLTTYACRGLVTKNLKQSGFEVQKTQGPIGKREMTIAHKIEAKF